MSRTEVSDKPSERIRALEDAAGAAERSEASRNVFLRFESARDYPVTNEGEGRIVRGFAAQRTSESESSRFESARDYFAATSLRAENVPNGFESHQPPEASESDRLNGSSK